jgi:hypothetical protein
MDSVQLMDEIWVPRKSRVTASFGKAGYHAKPYHNRP